MDVKPWHWYVACASAISLLSVYSALKKSRRVHALGSSATPETIGRIRKALEKYAPERLADLEALLAPSPHTFIAPSPSQSAVSPKNALVAKEIKTRLHDWDFGPGGIFEIADSCSGNILYMVASSSISNFGLCGKLGVGEQELTNLLHSVEANYKDVPYHNSTHASDVVHSVFWILEQAGLAKQIDPIAVFALLVGAAIHDMGHPGQGNAFHVNCGSAVALRYNDYSVLESMSISEAFFLMKDSANDILKPLKAADRQLFRSLVISMVISTDLDNHHRDLAQFRTKMLGPTRGDPNTPDCCAITCGITLHFADVASVAKEWQVYKGWIDRLFEEFGAQGDQEKKLNVSPIAENNDRSQACPPRAQQKFIGFFASDLANALTEVFPKMQEVKDRMDSNLVHLKKWEEKWPCPSSEA